MTLSEAEGEESLYFVFVLVVALFVITKQLPNLVCAEVITS
jgi:hypothetical protein